MPPISTVAVLDHLAVGSEIADANDVVGNRRRRLWRSGDDDWWSERHAVVEPRSVADAPPLQPLPAWVLVFLGLEADRDRLTLLVLAVSVPRLGARSKHQCDSEQQDHETHTRTLYRSENAAQSRMFASEGV